MLMKMTLLIIYLQISAIQIFTRVQVLAIPAAAVESQLLHLRENLRLISDDFNDRMDGMETKMQEIKDLLCAGCKVNTTTITPTTTTTTTTTTIEKPKIKPRTCKDWLQDTGRSGTYTITPAGSNLTFEAYCLLTRDDTETSFWTVILRRMDGSVDFDRKWHAYQRGFGNLSGEFFLGLDYIYALTRSTQQEIWVDLEHRNGKKGWAKNDFFRIAGNDDGYMVISTGAFSGYNIRQNSLMLLHGQKWMTKDNEDTVYNCAKRYGGGWWFKKACGGTCLTGSYDSSRRTEFGIEWWYFDYDQFKIKYAHMALRQLD